MPFAMPSAEPRVTYETIQHGIEELWSAENPAVDIVAVPGLGADPKNCWAPDRGGFNWLTDDDGLKRDFQHKNTENGRISARVLLYLSESAWKGRLKVKPEIQHLAYALLEGLQNERSSQEAQRRPIVFIGHSLGGLVIAKAICIAHSEKLNFPKMFEAITGAIFFGTPFGGTPVAIGASLVDSIVSIRNATAGSSLLDLLKPGNATLKELRREFLALAKDPSVGASMNLFCFIEQHPMNLEKMTSKLFNLPWILPNSLSTKMVQDESAILDGYDHLSLAKDHSNLVKFTGGKDPTYKLIRGRISRIIQDAPRVAKSRFHSVREYDRDEVKKVLEALGGIVPPTKMYQDLQKDVRLSDPSWILKEKECADWLDVSAHSPATSCLWIQGTEGRGKSSAVVSIVDQFTKGAKTGCETSHNQPLYAYFFCGSSHETLSVEELLKSLLYQLIYQQETLFVYAKQFAKLPSKSKGVTTSFTVENLWYSLVSMLSDTLVDKVYLVVHNLHDLPEFSGGTTKLLERLRGEIPSTDTEGVGQSQSKIRWLFTSRYENRIKEALQGPQTYEINLSDKKKYGAQVGTELRQHADQQVKALSDQKRYNTAFAYYASSLMGARAEDTVWIDITCLRLAQIPPNTKDTRIRRELEKIPKNLDQLLDSIWSKILNTDDDDTDEVKEMLRVLILVKEPVTPEELAILTGFSIDDVRKSLNKCNLLLNIEDGKVVFVLENRVKEHLFKNRGALLQVGDDEKQWQHGVLASRCYIYLRESLLPMKDENEASQQDAHRPTQQDAPNPVTADPSSSGGPVGALPIGQHLITDGIILAPEHSDTEDEGGVHQNEDGASTTAPPSKESNPYKPDLTKLLHYPIKHWLHHAGEATPEFAERISREEDFWAQDSMLRKKWLSAYAAVSKDEFSMLLTSENFTGLHTAASLGYAELVAALMAKGHANERDMRDSADNTPLHLAALWGRTGIVEELLNQGAPVDDGIEEELETPLAMAAANGQVDTMRKLLARKANVNAVSLFGPVINSAILSGNTEAVEVLVEYHAALSVSKMSEDVLAPLAWAAFYSDLDMLNFLLKQYHRILSTQDYADAFRIACGVGKPEVMEKLIMLPEFEAGNHDFQEDLDSAVEEEEWKCVKFLAENEKSRDGPNFDEAVIGLVEDVDENLDILGAIWENAGVRLSKDAINKALYIATDKEKENTVNLLLTKFEADANATGDEYGNALTAAAHDGTINIVNMLLDRQAEVDAPAGWALQIAAGRGHIDVIRRLLLADADVNRVIDKPQFPPCTALQAACEGGYDDVVKLLLDHGANPNKGGGQLGYPIVAAARFGFPDILTMVIDKEADVNVTGGDCNESPLIFASSYLPASSAIQLLDAGADINYTDNDGDTPLTMAAWAGDSELVKVLLKRGANPLHVTKRGVNALQYALLANRTECVRVLGDWLSLLLLGIHKAADARVEAPVHDVLEKTNYAGLRREVVEKQKAASKELGEYTTTDFFVDERVDVRSAGSDDDTHTENTGNEVDHGDGQDKAGDHEAHIGSGNRSLGHRNRANYEAEEVKTDDDEAQDRHGDDDRDVENEGNDEGGEDRGAGNQHDGEDDEYAIVHETAHMRLSEDEGSQRMQRGYGEDDSGNGSDAGDGDDNGEEDNMMDDNGEEGDMMDDDEYR